MDVVEMASAARLILTALALFAAACATVPPAGPQKVGTVFEASSDAGTAYIAASSHGPSHIPLELNAGALGAIARSNVLAFETLTRGQATESRRGGMQVMLYRQDGTSLLDDIPPELADRIRAQLDAHNARPGSWEHLLRTRTQTASIVLGQAIGSVNALERARFAYPSLDETFLAEAKRRGLPTDEVEGVLRGMVAHLGLTVPEATAALVQITERLENPDFGSWLPVTVRSTLEHVYAGNIDLTYQSYRADNCTTALLAAFCDKTIDGRNAFMVEKIDRLVKRGKTPFVAIGAMHLAGPQSVLKLLEKEGYRIQRLEVSPAPAPSSPPR